MQKNTIPLVLFLFPLLFTGCYSPIRLYEDGHYDEALWRFCKMAQKKKVKASTYEYLQKSYVAANQQDIEQIQRWKSDGNPEHWLEIYHAYLFLEHRDSIIFSLGPNIAAQVIPSPQDYSLDKEDARMKAAQYAYSMGCKFMELAHAEPSKEKEAAKNAYYYFQEVLGLYAQFQDTEALMLEAKKMGTINVLVQVVPTRTWDNLGNAPQNMLYFADFYDKDNEWLRIYTPFHEIGSDIVLDYVIELRIINASATPIHQEVQTHTYKEEIVEKIPTSDTTYEEEKKILRCQVIEITESRSAYISCDFRLYNTLQQDDEFSVLIRGEFNFLQSWIDLDGNKEIVPLHIRRAESERPVTPPTAYVSIKKAMEDLISKIRYYINRELVSN